MFVGMHLFVAFLLQVPRRACHSANGRQDKTSCAIKRIARRRVKPYFGQRKTDRVESTPEARFSLGT